MTTYRETFPPDKFEDGDELIGCNLSGRTVDFAGKAVTVRDCNAFDMTPINAENVVIENTPSWGKASTPDDSVPIDPVDREIRQAVDKIAELSYAYPGKTSARLKATVDLATIEGLLSADGKTVNVEAELP